MEVGVVQATQSTRLSMGGTSQSVPRLSNALKDCGWRVSLYCPDHESSVEYAAVDGPVVKGAQGFLQLLESPEYGVLHLHGIWNPLQHRCARWASQRGIPYVFSPHGMLEPWALQHKKWKKRVAWWLYQRRDLNRAALLHATAESEAMQFRQLGLLPKTVVIANGVEIPPRNAIGAFRDGSPCKTALFLSRIHPKKGLLMLAEAWASIDTSGWRLRVVGPDSDGHLAVVQARVRDLGVSNWSFHGEVRGQDKERAFSEADLFVLPTYSENFGIAVAEALAYGVPVLTTHGTPWQGIQEKGCGWWIDLNPSQLRTSLEAAIKTDRKELASMGMIGRDWMSASFRWDAIARQMAAAYQGVSRPGAKRKRGKPSGATQP